MKNSNGFKALQTLKEQYQIERENHVKEAWERRNKLMEKIGFVTPEEMIDYLIKGGRITDREGQYFRFENGMVEMIYEIYDEGAGPQGFGKKYESIDEFKDFVYNILVKHREYTGDKWLPTWVKDESYTY